MKEVENRNDIKKIVIISIIALVVVSAAVIPMLYSIYDKKAYEISNDEIKNVENIVKERDAFGEEIKSVECNVRVVATNWIVAKIAADIIGGSYNVAVVSSIEDIKECDYVLGTGSKEDRWLSINSEALKNDGMAVINIFEYNKNNIDEYVADIETKRFNGENTLESVNKIVYEQSNKEFSFSEYTEAVAIYENICDMLKKVDRSNREKYENNSVVSINLLTKACVNLDRVEVINKITGFDEYKDASVVDVLRYNYTGEH